MGSNSVNLRVTNSFLTTLQKQLLNYPTGEAAIPCQNILQPLGGAQEPHKNDGAWTKSVSKDMVKFDGTLRKQSV